MTDLLKLLEAWANGEGPDGQYVGEARACEVVDLLAPVLEAADEAAKLSCRDDCNGYAGELMKDALANLRAKLEAK